MKTRVSLMLATASAVALGACTTDPYAPTQPMSKTQQGALAGAALGGIYGAVRDKDKNNKGSDILKGAIVGGVAGGLGGAVLDAQAKALQNQMTTPGVQIQNTGNTLNVTLPEGVLFATDSTAVSGPAQNDLYALARNLQQYPNSTVQIIGHTDSTGSASYNMNLSQRRAQAVANILAAGGVSASRLAPMGRGLTQPVASNNTAQGRAANRRVEIIITPTR